MRSNTPSKINKQVFLFGPTASGKTQLVEDFFSDGFQIINADSVQVYRYLDIGSAKPSEELLSRIHHYNVDILDPWEQFTVGEFIKRSDEAARQIVREGDIPLVTGGTAFYFRHYLYGLSEAPTADPEVRQHVQSLLDSEGKEALHERLEKADPVSAGRISINDTYRITRALEVYYQTGRPLSSFELPSQPRNGMKPLIIGLERPRDELYERIDRRVDIMFREGLVDEIRKLKAMGADSSWPAMGAIGYREFLEAEKTGEDSVSLISGKIKTASRRYAKRQITFFSSFPGVHWIHPDDTSGLEKILAEYLLR
ncbi:MAG: tRNA (adenosine(37)-N6)-dimethylallyltransferase MiaA [Bullifex sp.]